MSAMSVCSVKTDFSLSSVCNFPCSSNNEHYMGDCFALLLVYYAHIILS